MDTHLFVPNISIPTSTPHPPPPPPPPSPSPSLRFKGETYTVHYIVRDNNHDDTTTAAANNNDNDDDNNDNKMIMTITKMVLIVMIILTTTMMMTTTTTVMLILTIALKGAVLDFFCVKSACCTLNYLQHPRACDDSVMCMWPTSNTSIWSHYVKGQLSC